MNLTTDHVIAARRELAKRSLPDFACMIDIPSAPVSEDDDEDDFSVMRLDSLADHHELLLEKCQGIEDGSVPNLMVLMPPGSAKSTYVDVVFVPWFMARKPRRNVILASYASDIAKKQGRRARQLIKSKAFENLTQVTLRTDQSAADEWALSNGSEYMSGGLLSGLTGNRAALGILDDPIRGREAAESETIRNKTWDAYIDDFCSRLIPGAPQIMILTRWHQDDPAGRILPEDWNGESGVFEGRDGRIWHVICLPAIADREDDPLGRSIGETLWPQWFNLDHWKPFKANARTWNSLYQQKPAPDEGSYFLRKSFQRYDEAPDNLRYYGTSDYAVSEGGGDYTRLRIWGIDNSIPAKVYMVDGWGGQTSSDEWIEAQCDLIARYRPRAWYGEAGVIHKAILPALQRRMRDRRLSCALMWLPSMVDKVIRARSSQAMVSEGRIFIRNDHDGDCFIDECVAFPAGRYDDDVDNLSLIGRAAAQLAGPSKQSPETPKRRRVVDSRGANSSWLGA